MQCIHCPSAPCGFFPFISHRCIRMLGPNLKVVQTIKRQDATLICQLLRIPRVDWLLRMRDQVITTCLLPMMYTSGNLNGHKFPQFLDSVPSRLL